MSIEHDDDRHDAMEHRVDPHHVRLELLLEVTQQEREDDVGHRHIDDRGAPNATRSEASKRSFICGI